MEGHVYTVEELMLDESFVSFCLKKDTPTPSHWETIIRDHPEQTETFAEAKKLILLLHGGLSKSDVNREIENVRRELRERSRMEMEAYAGADASLSAGYVVNAEGLIKRSPVKRVVAFAVAACLLVFLTVQLLLATDQPTDSVAVQVERTHFKSPFGKRRNVHLPDGSTVLLNGNSDISYTNKFNQDKREINLTGDAFFIVAKNPAKPFVVTANNISTTALGTAFYVLGQRAGKKSVTVELVEGKVNVTTTGAKTNSTGVLLLPGEKAITTDGVSLQKEKFDSTALQAWVQGRLVFDNTPVVTAIEQLERWYSVDITVQKEGLGNFVINGRYNNAALEDILKVICFSINRRFRISGNNITIQ